MNSITASTRIRINERNNKKQERNSETRFDSTNDKIHHLQKCHIQNISGRIVFLSKRLSNDSSFLSRWRLVAVVGRLEWTSLRHHQILRLFRREDLQLDIKVMQMQSNSSAKRNRTQKRQKKKGRKKERKKKKPNEHEPGDFLIELLVQEVDAKRVRLLVLPERNLSQDLVRERARHDERGVA
jgi:hypothetical protein